MTTKAYEQKRSLRTCGRSLSIVEALRGDFCHGERLGIGQPAPLMSQLLPPERFMETFPNVRFENARDTVFAH